jgi:Arc/MetJ family transcription regulator
MTTITINDELIQKVIDLTQTQNAQQAVIKILSEYLQQHQTPLFEQLRLKDADDELVALFERDKDTGRTIEL